MSAEETNKATNNLAEEQTQNEYASVNENDITADNGADAPTTDEQAPLSEQMNIPSENDKLAALEAEVAELKDKNLRLFSEFENFRRRTNKEKLELKLTAGQDIVIKLLEIVDDFERAQTALEKATDLQASKEAVTIIQHKLLKMLQAEGLTEMEAKGQAFNPDIHESLTAVPQNNEDMKGKVIDVVQKGYLLNEKPIRIAKVVIGA